MVNFLTKSIVAFPVISLIILSIELVTFSNAIGHSLHELNRPYFCSTCFSNTQDQNYHCCFYFFKCCAEARRGSRSTTPSPRYPGVPSHMTFIVQNRSNRPCNCKDTKLASNLCCRLQNSQNQKTESSSLLPPNGEIFKTAVNVQVMQLDGSEFPYQNTSSQEKTFETAIDAPEESTNTSEYRLGIEINDNPFDEKYKSATSGSKLFIPPSLAVDHVINSDSNQKNEHWKKQGWFTKEILTHQNDEK